MLNKKISTLELAQKLIQQPSITPADAGCQEILTEILQSLDFKIEQLPFGDVKNFWAKRGTELPLLIFAGHTDVVPPGPLTEWTSPPFEPTIRDNCLYGRGAADMKSSIAAMISAVQSFLQTHPQHKGSIGFLITSDEEGASINGTRKVIEYLQKNHEQLTWCIVGEASSEKKLGDTLKIGRRGSLSGHITIYGKQGHIAYPHLAINPIHQAFAGLHALIENTWDKGTEFFPATSLQFSNIKAGTGATNVIPNHLEADFNFRYSSATTAETLQETVKSILNQYNLRYNIDWQHSGLPFLTQKGELLNAAQKAIAELENLQPKLSTDGGTSDGRFIAPTGCQVIELGPCNASIHKINEHIHLIELEKLTKIYERILELLLA